MPMPSNVVSNELIESSWGNDVVDTLEDHQAQLIMVGEIRSTIAAAAPTGWLLMNGQAVSSADTLFPALWAVAPSAWKAGTTLNLPNMAQRFLTGAGSGGVAVGDQGGSNTATIAAANLPPHQHTIDHDHGSVGTTTQSVNHTHSIAHDHGNVATDSQGSHTHDGAVRPDTHTGPDGGLTNIGVPGATQATITLAAGAHTHNVDLPFFFGNSSVESLSHAHTVDLPNFTGSSGNGPGTGTALPTAPAFVAVNYIIRT